MRTHLLLAVLLVFTACARTSRPEPIAHSDLPPDTAFRVHPHVGARPVKVGLILTPPGELPVWSCEGEAKGESYGCPVATDWFRGPGTYELLVELKRGAEVLRSVHTFEAEEDATADVSLWLIDDGRLHLELASGVPTDRPSASAQGTLSREQILRTLKGSGGAFQGCFAGALQDSSELEQTRLDTWILIAPTGAVQGASVRGAAEYPELAYCVLSKLRALSFPTPKAGGLAVSYPLVFSR